MNTKILIPALVALSFAGIAYAAEAPAGPDPLGDKDQTKAEFQAKGAQMFDQMDANKDGKLDPADRAAHEGQMFIQIDTNKDGSLSREEFTAAHQGGPAGDHGQPAMAGGPSGPHGSGPHGGGKHGGDQGGMGMMMLQMADTNKDGAVSRDEFLAAHAKHFDMVDANHDGKLTKVERQAAHDKMRAMGAKRGAHKMGEHPMGDMPPPLPAN